MWLPAWWWFGPQNLFCLHLYAWLAATRSAYSILEFYPFQKSVQSMVVVTALVQKWLLLLPASQPQPPVAEQFPAQLIIVHYHHLINKPTSEVWCQINLLYFAILVKCFMSLPDMTLKHFHIRKCDMHSALLLSKTTTSRFLSITTLYISLSFGSLQYSRINVWKKLIQTSSSTSSLRNNLTRFYFCTLALFFSYYT